MTPSATPFKADRNQLIAVVAMLAAVFSFAVGELLTGFILFGIAAVFSIGGLFWHAHTQDKAAAAEGRNEGQSADSNISKD